MNKRRALTSSWAHGFVALLATGACDDFDCQDTATCEVSDAGFSAVDAANLPSASTDDPTNGPGETSVAEPSTVGTASSVPSSSGSSSTAPIVSGQSSDAELSSPESPTSSEPTTTSTEGSSSENDPCSSATGCVECEHECIPDSRWCTEGGLSLCETDVMGCRHWSTPTACESGECADAETCSACVHECSLGEAHCVAGAISTCVEDASGCRFWSETQSCSTSSCASATECVTCDHECSPGAERCEAGSTSDCVADPATGCRVWDTPIACQSGSCESGTECAPFDPCADHDCQNGASCRSSGASYVCDCAPGYDGNRCQTNVDDCESEPCEHGGACVDKVNGYQCVCSGAYTGKDCELPRFELLPGSSYVALSGDGSVAVGDDDFRAVAHRAGETTQLAAFGDNDWSFAADVSQNGSVIVGWAEDSDVTYSAHALKWEGEEVTELRPIASAISCKATSVSADGSVIVGACVIGYDQYIVRWQNEQPTNLRQVTGSTNCFDPYVSADGNTIVGTCVINGYEQPFRWTSQAGMQALTGYPTEYCRMTSVSSNGSRGVGSCYGGANSRGIRYDGGTSVAKIPSSWLYESNANWYPTRKITSDGSMIIGDTLDNVYSVAVRWTFSGTASKVSDLLSTAGGSSGSWRLAESRDLSDDGATILGKGSDDSAAGSFWIVRLD